MLCWLDPATSRQLGTAAYGLSVGAYASGMLQWTALPTRAARACCIGVGAIGASTLAAYPRRAVPRSSRARPPVAALVAGRRYGPALMAEAPTPRSNSIAGVDAPTQRCQSSGACSNAKN